MKLRFFCTALFLSCSLCLSAQEPAPSALVVLAQEAPNASAWVLASLDTAVPPDIRQNITLLREDLLDEGKTAPQTTLDAYRAGYQLCNGLITALDERDKSLVRAGVTQTQVSAVSAPEPASRRNYLMSWPQYQQDVARVEERKELAREARSILKERSKAEWAARAAQLRISLDSSYASYRNALRQDPLMVKALSVPATIAPLPVINSTSRPATVDAIKGSTPHLSPFTNSLGMAFVPVEETDVLFCIHETRRKDYSSYASEVEGVRSSWKNQVKNGVPCGHEDDHPVVGILWSEAVDFCEWLSRKEGRKYRLPTDKEWSCAAGIVREERWNTKSYPQIMNNALRSRFPWDGRFPPKTSDLAGNYADVSFNKLIPEADFIEGYEDGYATTAPVMSFKPNRFGIYDLGGNAAEWCSDWFNASNQRKFTRGSSWMQASMESLLSSNRHERSPQIDYNLNWVGFRCVMERP